MVDANKEGIEPKSVEDNHILLELGLVIVIQQVQQRVNQKGIVTNQERETGNVGKIIRVKDRIAQGKERSAGS